MLVVLPTCMSLPSHNYSFFFFQAQGVTSPLQKMTGCHCFKMASMGRTMFTSPEYISIVEECLQKYHMDLIQHVNPEDICDYLFEVKVLTQGQLCHYGSTQLMGSLLTALPQRPHPVHGLVLALLHSTKHILLGHKIWCDYKARATAGSLHPAEYFSTPRNDLHHVEGVSPKDILKNWSHWSVNCLNGCQVPMTEHLDFLMDVKVQSSWKEHQVYLNQLPKQIEKEMNHQRRDLSVRERPNSPYSLRSKLTKQQKLNSLGNVSKALNLEDLESSSSDDQKRMTTETVVQLSPQRTLRPKPRPHRQCYSLWPVRLLIILLVVMITFSNFSYSTDNRSHSHF